MFLSSFPSSTNLPVARILWLYFSRANSSARPHHRVGQYDVLAYDGNSLARSSVGLLASIHPASRLQGRVPSYYGLVEDHTTPYVRERLYYHAIRDLCAAGHQAVVAYVGLLNDRTPLYPHVPSYGDPAASFISPDWRSFSILLKVVGWIHWPGRYWCLKVKFPTFPFRTSMAAWCSLSGVPMSIQ